MASAVASARCIKGIWNLSCTSSYNLCMVFVQMNTKSAPPFARLGGRFDHPIVFIRSSSGSQPGQAGQAGIED